MDMRKTIKEKKDDNILRLPSCTGKRGNKLLCVCLLVCCHCEKMMQLIEGSVFRLLILEVS